MGDMNRTARDFLELILPEHAIHTITEVREMTKDRIEFVCSCNQAFYINQMHLSALNLTLKDAKYSLRNVPVTGQA